LEDNTITVPVVYQGGVFVPEQDVSFLAEGSRFDLIVPAPPDEWDRLLDELLAEAAFVQAAGLPEALDWMVGPETGGRWVRPLSDDASKLIDVERLLRWSHSQDRGRTLLL
jgi:hypothetical protein